MGHSPQIDAARQANGSYHYDSCFIFIKPILRQADFVFANLELTLGGPPYTGYPQFSSPDALASAIQNAGFDFLFTSNNHSLDRREKGLKRTIEILDQLNIPHTGTFVHDSVYQLESPYQIHIQDFKIALLNPTYGTNGIRIQGSEIVEMLDTTTLRRQSLKSSWQSADFRIVYVHWGNEYQRLQSNEQKNQAKFFQSIGADLVIGSHPHVIQPVDTNALMPVFYSLGNFISNQRDRYRDGGIIAMVRIRKTENKTWISDLAYLPVWVWKRNRPMPGYFLVHPVVNHRILEQMGMSPAEFHTMKQFFVDTRKHLLMIREFTGLDN